MNKTPGSCLIAKKEYSSHRFLPGVFIVIMAAMIVVTLYPFNFFPSNLVEWLSNEPGLYFNGSGIAHSQRNDYANIGQSVSVELLLKERLNSKNWGPREIFSFYDGYASPSLLVGQWEGRIFIYSRFERKEQDLWCRVFRTKERFPRGETLLVTVTFGEDEKAIYIDGRLNAIQRVEINDPAIIKFSGRYLLGNSPKMRSGWWGEIKGLAIYNRVLTPEEIATRSKEVTRKGMSGLTETPGCVALYPFNAGKGNKAKSILGGSRPIFIPESRNAFAGTLLSLQVGDMRIDSFPLLDFLKNIIFFVPFGILLTMIILNKYSIGFFAIALVVTLTGGLLSCLIEYLQLFLPTRISGLEDVFSNVIGSGLGMLVGFNVKFR